MRLIHESIAKLDADLARSVERTRAAQRDTTPDGKRAAGDEAALRGIPVVGVKGGKGGAIPGSRPGDNALRAVTDASYLARQAKRRRRR